MKINIEKEPYAQTNFYSGCLKIGGKEYEFNIITSCDENIAHIDVQVEFPEESPPSEDEAVETIKNEFNY